MNTAKLKRYGGVSRNSAATISALAVSK